jgi:hypothetical protein
MLTMTAITGRGRRHRHWSRRGSLLLEAAMGMGLASFVALLLMKASLLAISGSGWTVMQTLSDSYLSREMALSNRVPYADLTGVNSLWPDASAGVPAPQAVTLGKLTGGTPVTATITRFRVNETPPGETDTSLTVWRLHSVLVYRVGDEDYVKSRTTLRMQ